MSKLFQLFSIAVLISFANVVAAEDIPAGAYQDPASADAQEAAQEAQASADAAHHEIEKLYEAMLELGAANPGGGGGESPSCSTETKTLKGSDGGPFGSPTNASQCPSGWEETGTTRDTTTVGTPRGSVSTQSYISQRHCMKKMCE